MILDFSMTADRRTIRVSAPQVDLVSEMRNLVGVHTTTRQIVSIGDAAEEIQKNAPEYWARNGSKIEFVHPFNLSGGQASAGGFEPLLAARLVQWFSNKAFARMKRDSFKRMLLGPWVDRVDYDLRLEGFGDLPADTRRQFIRHLKKLLVAVRRVRLNDEIVLGR